MSLAEAQKWFGMDYRTVKKAGKDGKYAARQIAERLWEFDLDELPGHVEDAEPGD